MTVPATRPGGPSVPRPYDVSLVLTVHDAERDLSVFLASLDAQRGVDLGRIEVIAVDDGSQDGSLDTLRAWQESSPIPVTVLTRPHGGRASARSYGLEYATGTWVSFPAPCDVLVPDHLARVLDLAAEHAGTELIACGYAVLDERTGRVGTPPPRAAAGDRVVDLARTPWDVPNGVDATFFRRERVEALGLRFDTTLRAGSDDADFCARYLLGVPAPVVGLLGSVRYLCRVRDGRRVADDAAAPAPGRAGQGGPGLVDLLTLGAARTGRAPEWVQTLVVAELSRIVGADGAPPRAPAPADEDLVGLLRDVRRHLDRHVVAGFRRYPLDDAWRQVLLDGLGDRPWRADRAVVTGRDEVENLLRVTTRFTGAEPTIEYLVGGLPVAPVHTKVRTHRWLGRPLLAERIAWLPADGPLRVRVGGRYVQITPSWPGVVTTDADPRALAPSGRPPAPSRSGRTGRTNRTEVRPTRAARGALAAVRRALTAPRRRHLGAWVVLVHGPVTDGDPALRLFAHLREQRPDVDAWLAVDADATTVARLGNGRHADRILAVGTRRWRRLAPGCRELVSTSAAAGRLVPAARFTWLRTPEATGSTGRSTGPTVIRPHDLVVVADPREHDALTGDGTPSGLTAKEVRLVEGLDPAGVVAAISHRRTVAGITLVLPADPPATPAAGAGRPATPTVPATPATPAIPITPTIPAGRNAPDGPTVADLTAHGPRNGA